MVSKEVVKQLQENFDAVCAKQDPNKAVDVMTAITNIQIAGELHQISKMLVTISGLLTAVVKQGQAVQLQTSGANPKLQVKQSLQPKGGVA